MAPATCEHCGSNDLRPKRARTFGRRLYRAVTGRRRYRCEQCHHAGWTSAALPPAPAPTPSPDPGRPLEARDIEAARQDRLDRLLAVVAAVTLGALLAAFIGWALS